MEGSDEPLCVYCGVVRAVVYCKSDSARLCLQCDGCIHSANSLSRRHVRSLLCDKCNIQPAIVRCVDEKMSLCQGCDWSGNGCSGMGHSRQSLHCYTGCPSLAEFSRIWSSVLDSSSSSLSEGGWGSLGTQPINENSFNNCLLPRDQGESMGMESNKLKELESCPKFEPWMVPSSMFGPSSSYLPYFRDQSTLFPGLSTLPRGSSNFKDAGINDDDLCEGLNMDDVRLSFGVADEMFGCSQGPGKCHFEDGGLDCLLMEKNLSVTESNGPIDNAIEASSGQDCLGFQSSQVGLPMSLIHALNGSSNCIPTSCNRSINLPYPPGQVHSSISLSLSNVTGESSATDYQDCGLSPAFLTGESPWESSFDATCPQARDKAKMRYNEKKKTRTFGKQIRYASRKARADTRKRVKGRFVKAGEAYDYDPLGTRNF